jgi:hypothetical protein
VALKHACHSVPGGSFRSKIEALKNRAARFWKAVRGTIGALDGATGEGRETQLIRRHIRRQNAVNLKYTNDFNEPDRTSAVCRRAEGEPSGTIQSA